MCSEPTVIIFHFHVTHIPVLTAPPLSLPHSHATALPHPRLPRPVSYLGVSTLQIKGRGAHQNSTLLLFLLHLPASKPCRGLGRPFRPAHCPLHKQPPPPDRRNVRLTMVLLRRPPPGIVGGRSILPVRVLQPRLRLAHRRYLARGCLVFHLCVGGRSDDGSKSTARETRSRGQPAPGTDSGPAAD